jgi:hypothetical protein
MSRSARVRRCESIVVVVSVTGWKSPTTFPDSSRMGLSEKVKNVSSG